MPGETLKITWNSERLTENLLNKSEITVNVSLVSNSPYTILEMYRYSPT